MKSFFVLSAAAFAGVLADSIQVNYYSDSDCKDYIGTKYVGDSCTGNVWGTNSVLIVCGESNSCEGVQWSPNDACDYDDAVGALNCSCNDGVESDNGHCWSLSGEDAQYAVLFVQGDPFLP